MAGLITLLGPLALKLLGALAVLMALLAAYFSIKHKGVVQERARQDEVKQKVQLQVGQAASKDVEIDKKVQAEIKKIEDANKDVTASEPNKFKF